MFQKTTVCNGHGKKRFISFHGVRNRKDRDNRIRFSLVVRTGKELRNTNVFCVYSSTTRVVRYRAGRGKKVGFTCATWELRTHWTVSLDPCPQGRCYLPRNQPREGWFGGCCSDPSCPAARTYHSAATGQGHVERAAHLENSVCHQEGATRMGSRREGKPAGFFLELRHYFSCGLGSCLIALLPWSPGGQGGNA